MISERRLHDWPTVAAAAELAALLRAARAYLQSFHPRVCPACAHVFSADRRLDMRCPDCAHREEHPDAGRS
jgi:rubrerythrin